MLLLTLVHADRPRDTGTTRASRDGPGKANMLLDSSGFCRTLKHLLLLDNDNDSDSDSNSNSNSNNNNNNNNIIITINQYIWILTKIDDSEGRVLACIYTPCHELLLISESFPISPSKKCSGFAATKLQVCNELKIHVTCWCWFVQPFGIPHSVVKRHSYANLIANNLESTINLMTCECNSCFISMESQYFIKTA